LADLQHLQAPHGVLSVAALTAHTIGGRQDADALVVADRRGVEPDPLREPADGEHAVVRHVRHTIRP
jgi:hypothetical protein